MYEISDHCIKNVVPENSFAIDVFGFFSLNYFLKMEAFCRIEIKCSLCQVRNMIASWLFQELTILVQYSVSLLFVQVEIFFLISMTFQKLAVLIIFHRGCKLSLLLSFFPCLSVLGFLKASFISGKEDFKYTSFFHVFFTKYFAPLSPCIR